MRRERRERTPRVNKEGREGIGSGEQGAREGWDGRSRVHLRAFGEAYTHTPPHVKVGGGREGKGGVAVGSEEWKGREWWARKRG